MKSGKWLAWSVFALALVSPVQSLCAELIVSQLVVELQAGKLKRQDVELLNSGKDRIYVAVEPREIIRSGTPSEASRQDPDPQKLGLLVTPSRLILDPGQRKLIRLAAIEDQLERERIYRVTVKPVVGKLSTEQAGLKILLGYDILVLLRPVRVEPRIFGSRSGDSLTIKNSGNASVELVEGKECAADKVSCSPLSSVRLYAGAEKRVRVTPGRTASYKIQTLGKLQPIEF